MEESGPLTNEERLTAAREKAHAKPPGNPGLIVDVMTDHDGGGLRIDLDQPQVSIVVGAAHSQQVSTVG